LSTLALSEQRSTARERFVRDVVDAFEHARVEFVLLHGHDPDARDSDLDIAVTRRSLAAVDALVRAGTFGRMLQRLHYDVPWCFYYVVESDEPGRRYRQLDVACDPWGIGRYGPAIPLALDFIKRNPGVRTLDERTESAYLAIKRARKGAPQLARLAADVRRHRRTPWRLFLRGCFESARMARRVQRPTGMVVAVVGPDGTGKSTVAHGLEHAALGAFRRADRRHVGPGLLPPPARLLGRRPSDGSFPHGRPPSGRLGATARLAYLWIDALVGWLPRMAVPRVRSSLVVLERGWLDLAVDPRRYRLPGLARTVRMLGRALPRPDLALLLSAPGDHIAARKNELRANEIERQLRDWRSLLPHAGRRAESLNAAAPVEHVVEGAREVVHAALEDRQPSVEPARPMVDLAGAVARDGEPLALVEVDGRPRWLLPRRPGGCGPMRASLYRPARRHQVPAALALEAMAAMGRLGTTIPIDLREGVLPALRAVLGRPDLELGGIALSRDRDHRMLVALRAGARSVGFAKVSPAGEPLRREGRVLEALMRAGPVTFTVPRPLALLEWEGLTALVLEPIRSRDRALRPFAAREQAILKELQRLGDALAPVIGSADGLVPVHGDFTPWNTAPNRGGGYVVWDWEDARLGLPLEDLFHWKLQVLALFAVGRVEDLVAEAHRLNADASLRAYLQRRVSDPELAAQTREVVEQALALVDGVQP
jgi:hypothetical protein